MNWKRPQAIDLRPVTEQDRGVITIMRRQEPWLMVVLVLCLSSVPGCREKTPTMVELSSRRNKEITEDYVSDVEVFINKKSIASGEAVAHTGEKIIVSGTMKDGLNPDVDPRMIAGVIQIACRPSESEESQWSVDASKEWVGPRSHEFEFPIVVDLEPGDYDLRVYVTSMPFNSNIPHVEHVARGRLTVNASPSAQSQ